MQAPDNLSAPPRRALILAAGLGTRLRPLTWKTPKPLMTVWGIPLIDHAVGLLQRWGVQEFAVNTHWRAEALHDHLSARWPDTLFRISYEPQILGTGGALLPLRDFLEGEREFWIFNADVLASLDGRTLLRQHRRSGSLATLWLTDTDGPRTVEQADDGRITTFRSARARADGTFTFTGLHLVSGRIYRHLDAAMPSSIVTAYERAIAAGERVEGVAPPDAYWADSGTPEAVLRIHRDVRARHRLGQPGGEYFDPALDLDGRACIAATARCARNASIEDCVVGPGSRVLDGIRLEHCLVGANVTVAHDADHAVLAHPSDYEDERVDAAVAVLGWPSDETTVEALDARGSDRAFFRFAGQGRRAILAVYGAQRPENDRYAGHAEALRRAGVPVPGVLAHAPEARWLVMEDLGDDDLLGRVRTLPPTEWRNLYAVVLDTVVRLHRDAAAALGGRATEPAFDATVYRWERELFAEHMLRRRLRADPRDVAALTAELEAFGRPLETATPVIVHRDLQSTNIFFRDGRAYLIDFQGMRPGPAAYDLASLLCDPYVGLPRDLRRAILADYAARVPWGGETLALFHVAAVQRLVQALGAYARLSAIAGTERFAGHIAPAARILLEETDGAAGIPRLRAVATALAATAAPV
jgi:hypothetical protein